MTLIAPPSGSLAFQQAGNGTKTWQPIDKPFRAPLASKALAIGVLVVLAFDFPANWFRVSPRDAGVSDASAVGPLAGYFLLAAAGVAVLQLAKAPLSLAWGIRSEPLIPALLGLGLLSVVWSERPAFTIETIVSLSMVVVLSYWFLALFSFRQIMLLVGVTLAIGSLLHLVFVFALPQYGTNNAGGWDGLFIHENSLGRSSSLAVLHFLFLAVSERSTRYLWLGFAGLSVYVLVGSTSKTGLATAAMLPVLAAVFHFFRAKKTLYGASVLALTLSAVTAGLIATANFEFLVGDVLEKDVTLSGRTELWTETVEAIRQRPLLGYGWDGFWGGWFSPAHEILAGRRWSPPHSHNALLEYGLALGIPGMALGLAIFARLVSRSINFVRTHEGVMALWPLTYAAYAALFSTTEAGVIQRELPFLLLIVASVTVGSYAKNLPNPLRPDASDIAVRSETAT